MARFLWSAAAAADSAGLTAIDLGSATEIDANGILSASDNGDNTVDITIADSSTGGPDSGLDAPCLVAPLSDWDITKHAGVVVEVTWDDSFSPRPTDPLANYMGAIILKGTSLASGDGHYAGVRLSNRMLSSGRLGSSRATYTNFGSVTVQRLTVIFEADEQYADRFQYVTPRMETSGLDDRQTGNATTWSNTLSSDLHLGVYFDIGAALTGGYTVPSVSLKYAFIQRL